MSAAQNEIGEQRRALLLDRKERMKKVRKAREVRRRHVVTLPDYLSWYLRDNHEDLGYEAVPTLIHDLVLFAINDGWLLNKASLDDIEVAYKKHLRAIMDQEIEALATHASEDRKVGDGA